MVGRYFWRPTIMIASAYIHRDLRPHFRSDVRHRPFPQRGRSQGGGNGREAGFPAPRERRIRSRDSCYPVGKSACLQRVYLASFVTGQLAVALRHGSLPCFVTGTVAASQPVRNIMRVEIRSPPLLVLHFRVEWGAPMLGLGKFGLTSQAHLHLISCRCPQRESPRQIRQRPSATSPIDQH